MDQAKDEVGYVPDSGPLDGPPSPAVSVFSSAAAVMNLDKQSVTLEAP